MGKALLTTQLTSSEVLGNSRNETKKNDKEYTLIRLLPPAKTAETLSSKPFDFLKRREGASGHTVKASRWGVSHNSLMDRDGLGRGAADETLLKFMVAGILHTAARGEEGRETRLRLGAGRTMAGQFSGAGRIRKKQE